MTRVASRAGSAPGLTWWIGWVAVLIVIGGGAYLAVTRGPRAPVAIGATR